MADFATIDDIEKRWRPLTTAEKTTATVLIEDASDAIRVRWPDVDAKLESGEVNAATLVRIVSGMVRRSMLNRDTEGLTQVQTTTGPFSDGMTFANPNNNLYLSADDIATLDGLLKLAPRVHVGWLA